jgi:TetR/AcrR family transcriptional regulator
LGTIERREREKKQRENDIIEAAEKVIFSKGLEMATMDEIAEVAELSKGTLYLYFKNKEDLYLAIHARGTRILRQMFEEAARKHEKGLDKALAIGYAYLEFSRQYADYYNAMIYYESHAVELTDEESFAHACLQEGEAVLQVLAEAIAGGIADNSIRADVDPFKTALILWGQSMGTLQLQSLKGDALGEKLNIDFEELVHLSFDMMRRSLQNNP